MHALRRLVLALSCVAVSAAGQAAVLTAAEAELKAQAQQGISQVESDRRLLMARLYAEEQDCLQRFISAPCLEDLRQEAARENRILDLAKESLLQSIRRLEAEARKRSRDQRMEESRAQ